MVYGSYSARTLRAGYNSLVGEGEAKARRRPAQVLRPFKGRRQDREAGIRATEWRPVLSQMWKGDPQGAPLRWQLLALVSVRTAGHSSESGPVHCPAVRNAASPSALVPEAVVTNDHRLGG